MVNVLLTHDVPLHARSVTYEEWFPHPAPHIPVVGRFAHFVNEWEIISNNATIVSIVRNGYSPSLESQTDALWTQTEGWISYPTPEPVLENFLIETAREWQAMGVLTPAQEYYYPPKNVQFDSRPPSSKIFIHPTFVVEHPKLRLIGDLRSTNKRLTPIHFKMETWADLLLLLPHYRWAVQIDIADAYLHVGILKSDRTLMLIEILGKIYQPNAMLFGLTGAPRIWTKVTKVPIAVLRQNGVVIFVYIDDLLILGETRAKCAQDAITTIQLLQRLGFKIKWSKCQLAPVQRLLHLGLIIDLEHQVLEVPPEKLLKLKNQLQHAKRQKWMPMHRVAALLGFVQSLTLALLNVRVFTRQLQAAYRSALEQNGHRYNPTAHVVFTSGIREEIRFLMSHLEEWNGMAYLPQPHDRELFTDASDHGWSGNITILNRLYRVRRQWQKSDFSEILPESLILDAFQKKPLTDTIHINILEGLAILLSLRELTRVHGTAIWAGAKSLLCRSDNITTVVYLNKHGGRKVAALNVIVQLITKFLLDLHPYPGMEIRAEHIPGVENEIADWDSRFYSTPKALNPKLEYQLNPKLFRQIDQIFGPHSIDLMASAVNTQVNRFYSWIPDLKSLGVDAFLFSWNIENAYVNPPWFLIPRILAQIRAQKATVTLIAPIWPSQIWYPILLQHLIAEPIRIPVRDQTFLPMTSTETPISSKTHPWTTAAVWRLSGNDGLVLAFQNQLLKQLSTSVIESKPRLLTNNLGIDGLAGVSNGILIPFSKTSLAL